MKTFCKRGRALLLALALALSLTAPALAAETETPASSAPQAAALEETTRIAAEGAMTYGGAASISWALWDSGNISASGGLTVDRETGEAMQTEAESGALYGVGSPRWRSCSWRKRTGFLWTRLLPAICRTFKWRIPGTGRSRCGCC